MGDFRIFRYYRDCFYTTILIPYDLKIRSQKLHPAQGAHHLDNPLIDGQHRADSCVADGIGKAAGHACTVGI